MGAPGSGETALGRSLGDGRQGIGADLHEELAKCRGDV
jgi:hypothetical protein